MENNSEATMLGGQAIDAASVDPAEFAANVARASDEELAQAMSSELRGLILDEIFKRMQQHVRADRVRGVQAVIHWRIKGRPDGGVDEYQVVLENGQCTVSRELDREPRVAIELDGVDFLRLVTGGRSGPDLFMSGKLQVRGDLVFAAQVQGLFDIPKAA